MEEVARVLLSGLSYSMLLFLMASGLSLVLGVMGVVNLAHGSLYMIGAFTGLLLAQRLDAPWLVCLLAALIAAGIVGVLIEHLLLRRLHGQHVDQVLLTLGLVYIAGDLSLWAFGSYPLIGRAPEFLSASVPIGELSFPVYRFALIATGVTVAAALWWLQERTRLGATVRAGMDDREMTMGLGVNYNVVASAVFALGACLAGLAGFLGAPLLGAKWDMSFSVLLSAMIVVVVGGVGRVEGALAGALLIGMLETFGKSYFPNTALFTTYAAFVLVLLIRPAGLFGRVVLAASSGTRMKAASVGAHIRRAPWRTFALCGLALVALAVLPQFASAYFRSMLTEILIFGLFALSLNILFGSLGYFSLGHAAFFGTGAYLIGVLTVNYGWTSAWTLLPIVIIGVALLGLAAGVVALRTRGVYFIFVTLAIGELLAAIALKLTDLTGGSNGLIGVPYPSLAFFDLTPDTYFYFVLVIVALCTALLAMIARSPFGLALQGIRDDERRMAHLGYRTHLFKLIAYVIAGAAAGIAGALYAPFTGTVIPGALSATTSTLVMLMVIVGGARSFFGPAIGAAIVIALQYYASIYFPDRWNLILGVVFVLCVLWLRGGIVPAAARFASLYFARKTALERS